MAFGVECLAQMGNAPEEDQQYSVAVIHPGSANFHHGGYVEDSIRRR